VNFIDIPVASSNEGEKIALSPDGTRLGVWQYNNSQLTVYNTTDGSVLSQATVTGGKSRYATDIQFSADGMKLLLASDPALLFDVSGATATQLVSINGSSAHLYDDASAILATSFNGTTYSLGKYSASTGNLIST